MNKKILIIFIAILALLALSLVAVIVVMPDKKVEVAQEVSTPNSLIEKLGIARRETKLERLFAIKTYQGDADFKDMLAIAQTGGLEYLELDEGNEYMLVVPFKTNGELQIAKLEYDGYEEKYLPKSVEYRAFGGKKLYDNYSLLIRYTRPSTPKFEIRMTQNSGEQTATYQIVNMEDGAPVKTLQYIKDDINAGTESFGEPIKIKE